MRGRIVPELDHAWVAFEGGLNATTLNASPPAVNESHFGDAGFGRRFEVVRHDIGDIVRRERMEIQLRTDRKAEGHK